METAGFGMSRGTVWEGPLAPGRTLRPMAERLPPPRLIGLFLGPALAAILYFTLPAASESGGPGLSHAGRMTVALGAWLAAWWITEAIAIEAAALLPLALFPLAGVATMKDAARPYADEVVFLFLGGMLLGSALERWNLHRRLALRVMLLLGASPARLVGGLMLATAVISMWVSNTAAAVMMLPIGVGIVQLAHTHHEADGASQADRPARNFAIAAMLAIAQGASIGGVATIIGSPPNGVTVAFVARTFGDAPTFAEWALVGVPVMLVVLPAAWALLLLIFPVRGLRSGGAHGYLAGELRTLGPITRPELTLTTVFGLAAAAWIFREPLAHLVGLTRTDAAGKTTLLLTDAGIAILASLILFLAPVGGGRFALDWNTAGKIPWGILLLFGGGLSLAAAVEANGVDDFLAGLFGGLTGAPTVVVLAVFVLASIFLSEVGSNTAVATVLLPVVAGAAVKLGVPPEGACMCVGLGVSLAFMMPCGTPPNALVFTSGHLRVADMVKSGVLLNIACAVIITLAALFLVPLVWEIAPSTGGQSVEVEKASVPIQ